MSPGGAGGAREAVLAMSYGTPDRLEDVAAYYTHIRRGSPPPPELLDELIGRYRAVGGPTALNRITRRQAAELEAELERRGTPRPVVVGFKHVAPFIGDAVRDLAAKGIERVVALVLAPHYSLRGVAEYQDYAERARPPELELDLIESWHDHPRLIAFLANRLTAALERSAVDDPWVAFSAHSVPARVLERGDPYPVQLEETARAVARAAGVERWSLAYQSAGRTAEQWLGPDILEVLETIAERGERGVVVQSIGFVADHLEILYDLDLEARDRARALGLTFARAEMPNADPGFVAVLADVVGARLEGP